MHASWAARTDPGRRRSHNEDCYGARPELGLFVVADGLGGHAGGEVASRLAVETIARCAEETAALEGGDAWPAHFDASLGLHGNRLRAGFDQANQRIVERVAEEPGLHGMGTTAVAVLLDDGPAGALAHVGDCRAYLYRADGLFGRLTCDHSWVEERMREGLLSEADAREHPHRHIVTRALFGDAGVQAIDVEAEVRELTLRAGDRLLLCSDGLNAVLADPEIGTVMAAHADPQALCDELVRLANEGGGPDNVTTLVVDVDAR